MSINARDYDSWKLDSGYEEASEYEVKYEEEKARSSALWQFIEKLVSFVDGIDVNSSEAEKLLAEYHALA